MTHRGERGEYSRVTCVGKVSFKDDRGPTQLGINLQQQVRMIRSIPSFLDNIKSIHRLRLNTPNRIAILFNMFVNNRTLPLDNEKQHLRGTSLVARNTVEQFVAITINRLLWRVEISRRHDGMVIDFHTVIICGTTKCIDETTQRTLWTAKSSLIFED